MPLSQSIVTRWNDAGLNSSIKDLWPGNPNGPDEMLKAGATNMKADGGPANEVLPRARYSVMNAELVEMTAASKIYNQKFFIFLYSKQMSELNDFAELVMDAFENSQEATVDPFDLEEGCVVHLDWVERQDNVRYGEVKFTELLFDCTWVKPRHFPS